MIGGTAPGAGNVIAFNLGSGVWVIAGATDVGNAILSNQIYSNTGLGIDLNGDGVTGNDLGDADTGPNNLQNFPELIGVATNAGHINIQGSLNSVANTTFRIEFFANKAADYPGYGQGQTYLGYINVTTDNTGNASFLTSLSANAAPGKP